MNNHEKEVREYGFLLLAAIVILLLNFGISVSSINKSDSVEEVKPTPTVEAKAVPTLIPLNDMIPTPGKIIRETTKPVPTVSENDIYVEDITPTSLPSPTAVSEDNQVEVVDEPEEDLEAVEEDPDTDPNRFVYIYPDNYNEVCTYISVDSSKPVLLVGDSRGVGFYLSTGYEEFSYITKGSMGYNWLRNGCDGYNPSDLIQEYLDHNPSGKVIISLGVNDLGNLQKYEDWMLVFATWNPDCSFYYMSVNPCTGRADLEPGIQTFNSEMPTKLPRNVKWLDCYSYLMQEGFYAGDGVHYDVATYNKILAYILENL